MAGIKRFGVIPEKVLPPGEELTRRDIKSAKAVMDINRRFAASVSKSLMINIRRR